MFFIANKARKGGRLASCYGPFQTQEEAQIWATKMQPGEYAVYGPAALVSSVSVADPIVTSSPAI